MRANKTSWAGTRLHEVAMIWSIVVPEERHIAIFDKTKGGGNKVEYGGLYMMMKTVTKVEQ